MTLTHFNYKSLYRDYDQVYREDGCRCDRNT